MRPGVLYARERVSVLSKLSYRQSVGDDSRDTCKTMSTTDSGNETLV